jgi:two-component system sensor histidine kinase HupT/HoxJ
MKHKTQLHYVFMCSIMLVFIWTFGSIMTVYAASYFESLTMIFVSVYYFGLIFVSPTIFMIGLVYKNTKVGVDYKIIAYYVFFFIDYIVLLTNNSHHLYFSRFSIHNNLMKLGPFFTVHTVVSYIFILLGLFFLVHASIKNSGFFSRQTTFILIGILIPLVVNVLTTLRIATLPIYYTSISFAFAIIFYALAVFRYNFLRITPIALKTVVDIISDGFMVINEECSIVDYNRTMIETFRGLIPINRNVSFDLFLETTGLDTGENNLPDMIKCCRDKDATVSSKWHIKENEFDKHFLIEVTPIHSNKSYLGTIILFKDITENVKHIATIEEKHAIMMEQERLASLGQLIGGIAHNLKTPIMSISGAAEGLYDLVYEYEQSIGEDSVTEADHREIAAEMRSWLDKIKPYTAYMTDIIDTVKGQAMQFNTTTMMSFTISDLLKRIDLLMKYELVKFKCNMNTIINIDLNTELQGDINSLVQVFDNIIINAIQAYDKQTGQIDLSVEENEDGILFSVKDYAKGIAESIKNRLLKEMVTTKGKDGTGLGLYMSYSTIKGRFGGKMWFESQEGKGTTFHIQLPRRINQ